LEHAHKCVSVKPVKDINTLPSWFVNLKHQSRFKRTKDLLEMTIIPSVQRTGVMYGTRT